MNNALAQFEINLNRVRNLGVIYTSLSALPTTLDLTDVLRAEFVLAVSAFDHVIHEFTRIGMLEIFQGNRPTTESYSKFKIPIQRLEQALNDPGSSEWLDGEIRLQHGFHSFQKADKVADALRIISTKSLWSEVSTIMGMDAALIKEKLNLIVNRRNQIAHEADLDPSFPDQRWPIDITLMNDTIMFLSDVATAIYTVVN